MEEKTFTCLHIQNLLTATSSENPIIAGATALLIDQNWPDKLIIFEKYYLQNTLYVDAIVGLTWYIVVLLPAVLQADHLGPDSSLYGAVVAIASFSLVFSLVCVALVSYFWHKKSKMIKLCQPVFTMMILIGGILLVILCYMLLGENNDLSCSTRPYLFNIAFTFAFAPLLIKSWRVHVLFNLNPMAKNKLISTYVLVVYTMLFVVLDVVLMTLCLFVGGRGTKPFVASELTSNGAYSQLTYCGYHGNTTFFYTELAYKGLLIAVACFLSFKTRNVAGAIAGSKVLLAIVYNTAFMSGVIILITSSVNDVESIITCEGIGICFCVVMNAALLVLPVSYQILYVGDNEAAEEVMEEVFSKKRSAVQASMRDGGATRGSLEYRGSSVAFFNQPHPRAVGFALASCFYSNSLLRVEVFYRVSSALA